MDSYKHKKWRGQHFLTDKNMLKKIVAAANIQAEDTVVEIGAGTGNLTALLAEKAKRVVAIEIDRDLIPLLHQRISAETGAEAVFGSGSISRTRKFVSAPVPKTAPAPVFVEIIHDDARNFNPATYNLQPYPYLVVANIPYNITSLLIRRLLEAEPPPLRMILLVQKEVAQRICAHPPNMSILSVAVQYYATPSILFSVPRTCFSPMPKVDSAVIEITHKKLERGQAHGKSGNGSGTDFAVAKTEPDPIAPDTSSFFRVVHAGFAHKRKLLVSNLAFDLHIPRYSIISVFNALNIQHTARAQELSVEQWKQICSALFPFTGH